MYSIVGTVRAGRVFTTVSLYVFLHKINVLPAQILHALRGRKEIGRRVEGGRKIAILYRAFYNVNYPSTYGSVKLTRVVMARERDSWRETFVPSFEEPTGRERWDTKNVV